MNKATNKILSLMLAVCLTLGVLAVMPVTASAQGTLETHWIDVSEARLLAAEARAAGLTYVRVAGESPIGIRAEAAKELSGLRLEYDTLAGRSVKTRVYIGEPEKLTADTLLSGAVKSDRTDAVYALFEKYFSNKIHAIRFDQQGAWGQPVNIAARVDLTGWNTKNLHFYSYERETNTYRHISAPAFRIDANGYLHFATPYAKDIIVSEGALSKRAVPFTPPVVSTQVTRSDSDGGSGSGGGSYQPPTTNPAVNSVTVTPDTVSVALGTSTTVQLTADVSVLGGASQDVTWDISDEGTTGAGKVTVTVDGELDVAADASAGTAIVRATSVFDTAKYGICTVTVSTAPVEPETYSLTVGNITGQSATHGSAEITVGNSAGNTSGSALTVTATPAAGYQFVKWTSDAAGNNQVSTANPYTFNITANTSLYAVFEEIPPSPVTLDVGIVTASGSGAGSVAITNPQVSYAPGTQVTVTATHSTPYEFLKWVESDDLTATAASTDASYTFDITQNTTLYAVFSVPSGSLPNGLIIVNGVVTADNGNFNGAANSATGDIVIPRVVDGVEVTEIVNNAFRNNTDVTSVFIPNTVTTLGSAIFSCNSIDPSNIASVTFEDGSPLTTIPANTFANLKSLPSITLPEGITTIGSNAFYGCSALASIDIPAAVTSFGDYAFNDCTDLITVTFASGSQLASITNYAFQGCTSLAFITFTGAVPSLGSGVFNSVPASAKVYYTTEALAADSNWASIGNLQGLAVEPKP